MNTASIHYFQWPLTFTEGHKVSGKRMLVVQVNVSRMSICSSCYWLAWKMWVCVMISLGKDFRSMMGTELSSLYCIAAALSIHELNVDFFLHCVWLLQLINLFRHGSRSWRGSCSLAWPESGSWVKLVAGLFQWCQEKEDVRIIY